MPNFDQEFDARGPNRPLTFLRVKKALSEPDRGQVLHIVATYPGAARFFQALTNQAGNELPGSVEIKGEFKFLDLKGGVIPVFFNGCAMAAPLR